MDVVAIEASLQNTFGFNSFRRGQLETIQHLLSGHSSLAIFPTGSGKSLCYQFTATHLPHLTLVVSPLLALMKDQLEFLARNHIEAASIDSSLTPQASQKVMQRVSSGEIKILMVSVERFKNERFRQFISNITISMLVIDEAHCISEWGHNFRPDYLKLPSYQQQLQIPLVLLLTATATAAVKEDMAAKFSIEPSQVVQTGFYRSNLNLCVEAVSSDVRDTRLIDIIKAQQISAPSSGIVYVTLQKTAEQVAAMLGRAGLNSCAYHAGLKSDNREHIQRQFMAGAVDVIVATIAFGMGIDKADIRFVIHYDLPKSVENYSQEIGRSGRDSQPANCYTLANLDNINTLENFIYGDTPELHSIAYLLSEISAQSVDQQWEMQLYTMSNASNIRQLTLKTLLVQLELLGVLSAKYSYFAEFKIKLLHSESAILSQFQGERQVFLQQVFAHTDFKRVWGTLNFESLHLAYSADRSRVIAALEYLVGKECIELQSSQMTEVFRVDLALLERSGLPEQLYAYFKESERKEVKRIQTLVEFFENKNCLSYSLAHYFDDRQVIEQGFVNASRSCGHCSSCRHDYAKLEYSRIYHWPEFSQIEVYLQEFKQLLGAKNIKVTNDLCCCFLAGITKPVFTQIKARKLAGFACCENQRYAEIRERVERASGLTG